MLDDYGTLKERRIDACYENAFRGIGIARRIKSYPPLRRVSADFISLYFPTVVHGLSFLPLVFSD
jgi:hypothetical protein